jgi:hypothetical protein
MGFLHLRLFMYFFYVDESGSPEGHHAPLLNGETPIFSLNSLCIRDNTWRELDREYLRLKNRFFRNEIGTKRPEYFEIKGSELSRPGNCTNRRAHQFIKQVIGLCTKHNATLFSIIFIKNPAKPTPKRSLYAMALQYLCERFQIFLEENPDQTNAILILDSRMHNVDLEVAKSHMSFIFGHETGKTCDKILEAPMFANSILTVGLQVVDIIGSCIYSNFYQRNCMFVPGALNYSHMTTYWPDLETLEFKSQELYEGRSRNGFRVIDFEVGCQ